MILDILPAELRVRIYHIIVQRTMASGYPFEGQDERSYGGLIFSCKQVLAEYKFEANKSISPIQPEIYDISTMFYPRPFLIAPPSTFSYPTHMHISVPAQLFVYEEGQDKDPQYYFMPIIPEVTAQHTRITFSLQDTSSLDSKYRVYIWFTWLYNVVCDIVIADILKESTRVAIAAI